MSKGSAMRIEAKNLVKIYGDRCVVNDNSFYIDKGEVVCLLGPNGAGKTTTFYMIVGLVKPNSGQVYIDGNEITVASKMACKTNHVIIENPCGEVEIGIEGFKSENDTCHCVPYFNFIVASFL